MGGYLGGKYGPKRTIQAHIAFVATGWLMQGLAPNFIYFVIISYLNRLYLIPLFLIFNRFIHI